METVKYNSNIELTSVAKGQFELADNEYFVLMVTDTHKGKCDARNFFDVDRQWMGLECTGEKRIYISKDFHNRHKPYRGTTFIATVQNTELCNELKTG